MGWNRIGGGCVWGVYGVGWNRGKVCMGWDRIGGEGMDEVG